MNTDFIKKAKARSAQHDLDIILQHLTPSLKIHGNFGSIMIEAKKIFKPKGDELFTDGTDGFWPITYISEWLYPDTDFNSLDEETVKWIIKHIDSLYNDLLIPYMHKKLLESITTESTESSILDIAKIPKML